MHSGRRRYGCFLLPEFGFVADPNPQNSGEARPQRIYASQVYFSEYVQEQENMTLVPELSDGPIQVSYRCSQHGKLAVVNSGIRNGGFRICTQCGWAEPVLPGKHGPRSHTNPRSQQSCTGYIETYHLGHEFVTDVLELRFTGLVNARNDELWLSLLYALLEGASEALGIPRDDINGTLYPYQQSLPPAIILFDDVPGGAGHVHRVAEALPETIEAAYARVANCECGEETSCYQCLRNYYNQYHHDKLKRGLVREFLGRMRAGDVHTSL